MIKLKTDCSKCDHGKVCKIFGKPREVAGNMEQFDDSDDAIIIEISCESFKNAECFPKKAFYKEDKK